MQKFIGMVGFFSNFIQNYSDLIEPLYARLKKFNKWADSEKLCFQELKDGVLKVMLHIPDPDKNLNLYTDASDTGISGVLVSKKGKPVQFMSRKLTAAEARYDIVEREALAVYWSVNKAKSFLIGRHFKLYTDHKGLQYIFNNEKASPKVIRWRLNLQEFDFEVCYYRGSENVAADFFSRINVMQEFPFGNIALEEIRLKQSFCKETKLIKEAVIKSFRS